MVSKASDVKALSLTGRGQGVLNEPLRPSLILPMHINVPQFVTVSSHRQQLSC